MRRALWYRLLTGLWALWFTAVLSGPAELHACPQHGQPSAAGSHAAHGGHAAHAAPSADESGTPSHDASKPCTCLGHCCGALPLALPALAAELHVNTRVVHVAAVAHAAAQEPTARPRYALPFANGPPARVVDAATL